MQPGHAKSVLDPDVPEAVRDAATKGIEAAQREDLRTAYGYFLRAKKAAGREKFDDLTFLVNVAGLGSGEISKWNDRLRTEREAFHVAGARIDWLVTLFEIVFADATGLQLAHREAQDKLWYDTAPAVAGEWYGISWLAGQVTLRFAANIRKQFDSLAHQILWQIVRNLRAIRDGGATDDVLPDTLLEVERLADALGEAPSADGKRSAAQLYTELLALPCEVWAGGGQGSEEGRSVEELRERLAVRLEVVQAATRGGGGGGGGGCGGCCGSVLLLIGTLAGLLTCVVLVVLGVFGVIS
jgi:hypothetical protein